MSKPTNDDLLRRHKLMYSNPQRYLAMINEDIRRNPSDPHPYFARHQLWHSLGRRDLALQDVNTSLSLEENPTVLEMRGWLLCEMGRYVEALDDFDRSQTIDPDGWKDGFGPLLRANCHAWLGNESAALADCDSLPDDHWLPGIRGLAGGNKQQVATELRRRAAEAAARRRSSS